ncbi:MAG TPA: MobF family relaxase [Candidatus Dormibacteraeota bacterium]|nr:MobF family relaxase [Candidatus Dormibacteraeota bacterium]
MLSIGKIFAGGGWRYLIDAVGGGGEDYYLADVARGEAPGRWGGGAAAPELGLSGQVTPEQMERVYGLLLHPTEAVELGRSPSVFRPLAERIEAARAAHQSRLRRDWVNREAGLVADGLVPVEIEAEQVVYNAAGEADWAEREAMLRRRGERRSVAGFDLTFSPPKSVSVLWAAADEAGRVVIWDAHHAGVEAALAYLEREAAWSRAGHSGIRSVDTTGWVVASFDHRMSRSGDVQIHTHNAVLNRVRCSDGQWRSLDARAIYRVAASAGALYDRVREAALEASLRVRHEVRKEGGPREIVGVPDEVCALFSTRRSQVTARVDEMAEAYGASHGHAPSDWLRSQMSSWATLQTRQKKDGAETTEAALARWSAETKEHLDTTLAEVWAGAVDSRLFHDSEAETTVPPDDEEVVTSALIELEESHSTWTRYDLARSVTRQLGVVSGADPDDLLARIDALVDTALATGADELGVVGLSLPEPFCVPERLRRTADGVSVYRQHGAERYTTTGALSAERRVLAAAQRRDGPRVGSRRAGAVLAGAGLGLDQELVVRDVLGSGRVTQCVLGPAGTGKTFAMAALARAWRTGGGRVLGLAPSETAARVLGAAAGIPALNVAKVIWEHAQRDDHQRDAAWAAAYGISPGDLWILDEATMASRTDIDALVGLVSSAGAKLVLMGDDAQLDSPEASGVFRMLVERTGAAQLGQVRRFSAPWEAAASLRLRAGDVRVLEDYELRGRIIGGEMEEMESAALEGALADWARGRDVLLLADTNQVAAALSERFRAALVERGRVDDAVTVALADGNRAGVGDVVVTRRNDRHRSTTEGSWVANRDRWEVVAVGAGGITARRVGGEDRGGNDRGGNDTVELDAAYLAEWAQLGYAGTVHSSQGQTVDACHALVSPATSRAGLYVGLTRGRVANYAYVVTVRAEGADADSNEADPLEVLAGVLTGQDDPLQRSALDTAGEEERRRVGLDRLFPIWGDLLAEAGRARWADVLANGVDPSLARATVDSPAWGALAARLRTIEASGTDAGAALLEAARLRGLEDAEDIAAVLHWRLRRAESAARVVLGSSFAELTPANGGELDAVMAEVAGVMDARMAVLAETVAAEAPAWAVELGPRPEGEERQWSSSAGLVAGYREAFGWDDPADPLGPRPPAARVDARAWWDRAALALGQTEPESLAAMSNEELNLLVEAARAEAAPPRVAVALADLSAQLREAELDEGRSILAGDAAGTERAHLAQERLGAQVAGLEEAHRAYEAWSGRHGLVRVRAEAARAELALRAQALVAAPSGSWSRLRWEEELAHAEALAETMEAVVGRHSAKAGELAATLAVAEASLTLNRSQQPVIVAAAANVRAEARVADRIDDLRADLDRSGLVRGGLRGQARAEARDELDGLLVDHPELSDGAARAERWSALTDQARYAQNQRLAELENEVLRLRVEGKELTEVLAQARSQLSLRHSRLEDLQSARTAITTDGPDARPVPQDMAPAPSVTPSLHVPTTPEILRGPQITT